MVQRLLQRHPAIRPALRPREPGAGGRQRLEAHLLEHPRAANVPWVGDHETAGLMKPVELEAKVFLIHQILPGDAAPNISSVSGGAFCRPGGSPSIQSTPNSIH